ncbi:MAG: hypothetical protein ACREMB_16530 [Candidatus Rokuibacteriota bacterium]
MTTFRLAPMSPLVRLLTGPLLALPVVLAFVALTGPPSISPMLGAGCLLVPLVYFATWLYARPTRFEVGPAALVIVWPMRRRHLRRTDIAGARGLAPGEFRREFGWGVRIGVGGCGAGTAGCGRRGEASWTCTSRARTASSSWSAARVARWS